METLRVFIIKLFGFIIFLGIIIGVITYFYAVDYMGGIGISLYTIIPILIGVPLLIGTLVILIDNNSLLRDIRNQLRNKEE